MIFFKNKSSHLHIQNLSWLALDKAIRIISNIIFGIMYARFMGPNDFGAISLCISIVSIISPIASLGLSNFIVLDFIKTNSKEILLKTASALILLSSILTISILYFSTNLLGCEIKIQYLLTITSLGLLFQINTLFETFLIAESKGKHVLFSTLISTIIAIPLKFLYIFNNPSIFTFGLLLSLESLLSFLFFIYIFKQNGISFFEVHFDIKIAKNLLKKSIFFILSSLFIVSYMKFDQLMISKMVGDYALGLYVSSVRISEAFYLFPITIVTALYPAIVKSKIQNEILYTKRHIQLYALMIYSSFAASLFVTFFSNEIVDLIYGRHYKASTDILRIYIWSTLFVFIGSINGKWLITEGLYKYILVNTFIGSILNLTLNYFLIRKFGISGAAYSTLISYSFASFLILFFWKRTRPSFYQILKSPFTFSKEII